MDHSYDSARVQELPNTFRPHRNGPPEEEGGKAAAPEFPMSFPKEFNRSFLRSLDRRFAIVLLLVFIFEPTLIIYLLMHSPRLTGDQYVAKLQSKYVELFLQDFVVETPAPDMPKSDLLVYAKEYAENLAGEAFGTAPDLSPLGEGSRETRTGTREGREARRRSTSATRDRARDAMSESVGRIGVLGIITSGSSLVSTAPVEQILNFAALNAVDLEQKLSQVSILRVPRVGTDYFGPAVGSALGGTFKPEDIKLAERQVRGSRSLQSGLSAEDLVTALAAAPDKKVVANRTFEKVAEVPSLIDSRPRNVTAGTGALRGRPETAQASRDPMVLKEIVMAHSPAIRDCYRAHLKNNPQLKGKVEVRFKISPEGYVYEVSLLSSTIDLPQLHGCILSKISRWRDFGRVDASQGETTLRQTYVFGY